MTPLHWASDRGFTDLVSTLVKYNANIDAKDAEGQTPLHYGRTLLVYLFKHKNGIRRHQHTNHLICMRARILPGCPNPGGNFPQNSRLCNAFLLYI